MKEQHTTKNITPPKATLEALQRVFAHCFDKEGNFDIEKFKQEIDGAEVNFSKESYGMDWLGKSYARVRATDPATTLIKEDVAWNSKEENKNSENLLIKGDNLEVLKHLSHAYHEQVKMIYIDPPYNTGTDGFVYEDDRKFTPEEFAELAGVELEQAKRILEFVDSKSNSHSAWLSFMYPRLYIARQLLKDDGVIFVSIDDNEVAQLRILMDDVFGSQNFEGHIHWRRRHNQPNDKSKMIGLVSEHILVYAKSSVRLKQAGVGKLDLTGNFSNPDNDPRGDWATKPWKTGDDQSGTRYTIISPTGQKFNEEWMGEETTFHKLLEDKRIVFTKSGDGLPRKKYFRSEREAEGQCATNWFEHELFGNNQRASDEISLLFGEKNIFSNPKPTDLIKGLLKIGNVKNNDFVLDFFPGSGTTGDATMALNAEDGIKRKFVLVQLPEIIDPIKNKAPYGFIKIKSPSIFDITKERLVRATKKIKEENKDSEHIAGVDFGFKIFESAPIWDGYADEPTEYSANLKMFDVEKLKDTDLATLLTTWKTSDGIPLTTSLAEVDLGGYIGHYSDGKLYLVHAGFTAKHLTTLLKKIDTDSTFSPATIILFGYHFESARMREIAENVKSYANKKSIDIECITRY